MSYADQMAFVLGLWLIGGSHSLLLWVGLMVGLVGLATLVWSVLRLGRDRPRGGAPRPGAIRGRPRQRLPADAVPLEADRPVPLDDPEVPASVRELAQRDARPGDVLWRCVRQGAATGPLALLGWGQRPLVVEWWLLDAEGELIGAYWPDR